MSLVPQGLRFAVLEPPNLTSNTIPTWEMVRDNLPSISILKPASADEQQAEGRGERI
jgi:hypothetical protein